MCLRVGMEGQGVCVCVGGGNQGQHTALNFSKSKLQLGRQEENDIKTR